MPAANRFMKSSEEVIMTPVVIPFPVSPYAFADRESNFFLLSSSYYKILEFIAQEGQSRLEKDSKILPNFPTTSENDGSTENEEELMEEAPEACIISSSPSRPYECEKCKKKFISKESVDRHIYEQHRRPKTFFCSWKGCNKSFSEKNPLTRHLRTHTQEKPFVCSTCKKKFNDDSNRKRHEYLHTGRNGFICRFCPGKFTRRTDRRRHERQAHTHISE
jgi:uncharacterized Zn-finger protein